MDEKPELNAGKDNKGIEQRIGKIRQFCLEAAGFVLVVDPFERGREMLMKGYADVFGQRHPPIFTPPRALLGTMWGIFGTGISIQRWYTGD